MSNCFLTIPWSSQCIPNLPKKRIHGQKQKKWMSSLNSTYSNYFWYQISAYTDNFDFLTRFTKKGFFWSKTEKVNTIYFLQILRIQIILVQNFSSNWQFWFFGSNLPKKVFPVKNRKNEHHHGILHIWISLGTKFQLKLIILSFWTKFTQKRYFQLKTTSSPRTTGKDY